MRSRKEIEKQIYKLERELKGIDNKIQNESLSDDVRNNLMFKKAILIGVIDYLKWVLKGKSSKGIEKALSEISRIADLIEEFLQNRDSNQVKEGIDKIKEGISILEQLLTKESNVKDKISYNCPKCGSDKFVLTETVTITISMFLDLSQGDDSPTPYFKENQVVRQYTLICCGCGKVSMFNEGDYFSAILPEFSEEGIGYDAINVIEKIKTFGKESLECNSNLENST